MLPVRPKPQVDESFTSWLIRVANANGIPVGTFCHFLSKHQHFFTRDTDRPTDKQIVCDLARLTGTPISAAAETTIHLLERRVFPMLKPNNVQQMITVLGVYHRTHRKYGQAFCPQCLADEGYYRLSWRLVFITHCMIDVGSAASLYVFIAVLGIPVILAGLIAGKLKLYQ